MPIEADICRKLITPGLQAAGRDKLTPSVLAHAFRGQLFLQDPEDEPAEKVLERLTAAYRD